MSNQTTPAPPSTEDHRVQLCTGILRSQRRALEEYAYQQNVSLAEAVRQAIDLLTLPKQKK